MFSAEASTSINALVCSAGMVQLTVACVGLVKLWTRTVGAEYKTFARAWFWRRRRRRRNVLAAVEERKNIFFFQVPAETQGRGFYKFSRRAGAGPILGGWGGVEVNCHTQQGGMKKESIK